MGNLIQVTEKYSIGSDSMQWIVWEKAPVAVKNPHGRKAVSYHGTLVAAVQSLSQLLLRLSDETSMQGLSRRAREINDLMNKTFNLEKI